MAEDELKEIEEKISDIERSINAIIDIIVQLHPEVDEKIKYFTR